MTVTFNLEYNLHMANRPRHGWIRLYRRALHYSTITSRLSRADNSPFVEARRRCPLRVFIKMKLTFALRSLLMLIVSFVFLIILTLADRALAGTSIGTQRLITVILLVLAPLFGSMLAVLSLIRKDGKTWLAVISLIANTLFALFHLALVFFAG